MTTLIETLQKEIIDAKYRHATNHTLTLDEYIGFLRRALALAKHEEQDEDLIIILAYPQASRNLYYGDRLSTLDLIGGKASIDGVFEWEEPNTMPQASKDQSVVFKPFDKEFDPLTGIAVNVTVVKVPVAVQTLPHCNGVSDALTLADLTLINGAVVDARNGYAIVQGSWAWDDEDEEVIAGKGYLAHFTPANTKKYNSLSAVIILNA